LGKLLAYDAFAGTLIATSGTDVTAIDPTATQPPIACILDAADMSPVTSIAPGELLTLFGEFSSGTPASPAAGQVSTSLDGVTVGINGIPSPLLYVGGEQINFQAPYGIAGAAQANIEFASSLSDISDSPTLPIVASNPAAFLNTAAPSTALATCTIESAASVNAVLPLALNPDGSVNTCLNPAAPGSTVTLFLNGLGVTSTPVVTVRGSAASVSAAPGATSGVWQVSIRISANAGAGGNQISLTANGTPVRDGNLVVWVN
jgi:uncharacterized protein (TIGR03437 family)